MSACVGPLNYTNPDGPRFTGCGDDVSVSWHPLSGRRGPGGAAASSRLPASASDPRESSSNELRIVSFNIKFSEQIDRAIALLQDDPSLREADVLLLQEMDEPGVRRIARAFGHCWVYYPATLHPQSRRHFGNAILSRYPIREDHKVLLPQLGQFGRTQRIATAATLDVKGTAVRVYSVHLATMVELGPKRRADQARAIVDDAARFEGPVLVGGDLNAKGLGEVFVQAGYDWSTRDLGKTTKVSSIDHFFVRGLTPASGQSVGKSPDSRGSSDHVPIWARLKSP
jgi:endonuclease/exonuclease/phosphatase family metal-dependent hydrolase